MHSSYDGRTAKGCDNPAKWDSRFTSHKRENHPETDRDDCRRNQETAVPPTYSAHYARPAEQPSHRVPVKFRNSFGELPVAVMGVELQVLAVGRLCQCA